MADDGCRVSMGMGKGLADHPDFLFPPVLPGILHQSIAKKYFFSLFTLYKKIGRRA